MTNKTKHTPWIIEYGSEGSSIIDARGYIICTNGEDPSVASDDEMTHIVKCVNMHDELVEALKNLHVAALQSDVNDMSNDYGCDALVAAYETLKKAGAL